METVWASPMMEMRARPAVAAGRKPLRLFILKLAALPGWLAIGGFLAWLVQDFGRASGFGQERLAASLILFMFVMSSLLISMISWNSYRISTGKLSW